VGLGWISTREQIVPELVDNSTAYMWIS